MSVHFMKILYVYICTLDSHLLTLKAHITKSRMLLSCLSSAEIIEASLTNSVDQDQTASVGAV